jgi:hypothetical protein
VALAVEPESRRITRHLWLVVALGLEVASGVDTAMTHLAAGSG